MLGDLERTEWRTEEEELNRRRRTQMNRERMREVEEEKTPESGSH
jgi:hypothetical protein